MREGTEGVVKLEDVRAPVFRALLHFVYTDALPAVRLSQALILASHILAEHAHAALRVRFSLRTSGPCCTVHTLAPRSTSKYSMQCLADVWAVHDSYAVGNEGCSVLNLSAAQPVRSPVKADDAS